MSRYALVHNTIGNIWYVGDAPNAIEACQNFANDVGGSDDTFCEVSQFGNAEVGFFVYEVPSEWGSDETNVDELSELDPHPTRILWLHRNFR